MEAASKKTSNYGKIPEWFPELNGAELDGIAFFRDELLRFNKTVSLISISTIEKIDQAHVADSILGWRAIRPKIKLDAVHDIGSGNGFPGIISALLAPEISFVLVEADLRKAEFLKHCASYLKLNNLKVITRRAEMLEPGKIRVGMSRGFASIQKTLLTLRKATVTGGTLFHFKGPEWSTEVGVLPQQLCSTWNTRHVADYKIPDSLITHTIVESILNP